MRRDKKNVRDLRKAGWQVLVIWECQTRNIDRALLKTVKFLEK